MPDFSCSFPSEVDQGEVLQANGYLKFVWIGQPYQEIALFPQRIIACANTYHISHILRILNCSIFAPTILLPPPNPYYNLLSQQSVPPFVPT